MFNETPVVQVVVTAPKSRKYKTTTKQTGDAMAKTSRNRRSLPQFLNACDRPAHEKAKVRKSPVNLSLSHLDIPIAIAPLQPSHAYPPPFLSLTPCQPNEA